MSTPLWRLAFDAVERPLAAAAESWVQSDAFMDLAAAGLRVQRRTTTQTRRMVESWLALWGMPTRQDVTTVINQVASLERQVRQLAAQVEERG